MSDFSDTTEDAILESLLNGVATGFGAQLWIALSEDKPTDAGVLTELSGNGYGRASINAGWTVVDGIGENNVTVTFPQAVGGDWNEATWWSAWTLSSGGVYRFRGLLVEPITVLNGQTFQFAVGSLQFQAD